MQDYPNLKYCLNTSEENLAKELYEPCLKWAEKYDRGVGYFTSGWLKYNIAGMSDFASRGGRMRLITSPIISNKDYDAIAKSRTFNEKYNCFANAMKIGVDALSREMDKSILNAFAWMVYDGIMDIKFAVPKLGLNEGNFHDKFGIFYNKQDYVSFSGSQNDSMQGFNNYESIKVFCSWLPIIKDFAYSDKLRFEKLWNNNDLNIQTFSIEESIKKEIFLLRCDDRPYKVPQTNKWVHQDIAVDKFLQSKNGILAMATGTGKTVTAIKIIQKLFHLGEIERVIITMYGNDLLEQWDKQLNEMIADKTRYKHYGDNKGMQRFLILPDDAILLISREGEQLANLLQKLESGVKNVKQKTMLLFDEVHGAGSNNIVRNLKDKISPYTYRLGLSATPEREYDEVGNDFIETEIGSIIFEFTLEDAITKGILCEFDYHPINYSLTEEEKQKKKRIIAAFNQKKKEKDPSYNVNDMYTQLALINKKAQDKLLKFDEFIKSNTHMLEKCIIFVQDKNYGEAVQDIVFKYKDNFHTYYAEDESDKLSQFAEGKIGCLITCKKVSEGIDISSVTNIILFASDRSRLVTTQRIGRALRVDKNNPDKKANIIDFIIDEPAKDDSMETADVSRRDWLQYLSSVRRNENE